ncbi:MAG: ATP-dependent RNA helicase RhlE [Lentisphaerae bacterium GWF2_45_14]|nr:MAG: ATP-dependent RNA helicase RhlE [Lentisphaerae bacterium GWF2_45_14]
MSFDKLGLNADLLSVIESRGYTQPTPIQAKAIPVLLSGRDIIAEAQTGTGKTAAFTLPILQLIHRRDNKQRHPKALILTPTRELAAQVNASVITYGKNTKLRSSAVYGGVSIRPQINSLRNGTDILIATPGRLLDHVGQRTVNLSEIEILVLDEADRMLDMGFIHDIRKIIEFLPKKRQTVFFSATYSNEVKRLADTILTNPQMIEIPKDDTPNLVTQIVYPVEKSLKKELLAHLITEGEWDQVLIFMRTRYSADRLAKQLNDCDISAASIHGDKTQAARTKALGDFKSGRFQVLVATDVAARGIDIVNLPHVVNFDMPHDPNDYIHRIGRTGRAGIEGVAVSFVSAEEKQFLDAIQRLIGHKIEQKEVKGITQQFKAEPEKSAGPQKYQFRNRNQRHSNPHGNQRNNQRSNQRGNQSANQRQSHKAR